MDLVQVTEITSSIESTIAFLQENNLLCKIWICCQRQCHEVKCRSSDKIEFKCLECNTRHSVRTNSIFYNVHVKLSYLFLLTYLFATNTSVSLAVRFLQKKVGAKSIALWYDKLRDVMSHYMIVNPVQLGGPDSVVEIDETCLGRKQKYHRGAMRGSGQKWVLGMIDRQTKLCHIQLVENRTRNVLLPIIEMHLPVGTVIHTDEAPVYQILNSRGFEHYTVCH